MKTQKPAQPVARSAKARQIRHQALNLCLLAALLAIPATGFGATYTVTAYDNAGPAGCRACCGKWAPLHRTASGERPAVGVTCAANRWPFGTRLRIEGVGVRVVQDRLLPKYGDRVEVFMPTHRQAKIFGKRRLKVEVLK